MLLASSLARAIACLLALGHAAPAAARAGLPRAYRSAVEDPKAFEAGFIDGQGALERGQPLEAARIWLRAATHLPERTANRDNRAAIYEYIADAFQQALRDVDDPAQLREAVNALQDYFDDFTRAYGTETTPSAKITGTLVALRRRLDAASLPATEPEPAPEPEPASEPEPEPAPAHAPHPGRGLVIAGAFGVGLGLGAAALAAGMAARGEALERDFDDPANDCRLDELVGECAQIYERGRAANALVIAGVAAGALFVGGGVAMLLIGRRRAAPHRSALRPVLAPGLAGLSLRLAF
jgi:hypothetical protein